MLLSSFGAPSPTLTFAEINGPRLSLGCSCHSHPDIGESSSQFPYCSALQHPAYTQVRTIWPYWRVLLSTKSRYSHCYLINLITALDWSGVLLLLTKLHIAYCMYTFRLGNFRFVLFLFYSFARKVDIVLWADVAVRGKMIYVCKLKAQAPGYV